MSKKLDPNTREIINNIFQNRRRPPLFVPKMNPGFARWFILQMIDYIELIRTPFFNAKQEDIEALLLKAKEIALSDRRKWRRLTSAKIPTFRTSWYKRRGREWIRYQVVYGILGVYPQLIDIDNEQPEFEDFLSFIIERRFRATMRMKHYVNGGKRRKFYFAYPYHCEEEGYDEKYRLNPIARPYWKYANTKSTSNEDDDNIPFILSLKSYQEGLEIAIDKLFIKRPICQCNLVDCAMASCIVLIDSLMAAKERGNLLLTIVNQQTNPKTRENYITIDHPELPWGHYPFSSEERRRRKQLPDDDPQKIPEFHIITDRGDNSALFEYASIKLDQLQIGDRVYLYNHQLYRTFHNGGSWRGEHAFVNYFYDRNKDNIRFEGHGVKAQSISKMFADHFDELNTLILMTVKALKKHLIYRAQHGKSSTDGVDVYGDLPSAGYTFYVYTGDFAKFRYMNYEDNKIEKVLSFYIIQINPNKIAVAMIFRDEDTDIFPNYADIEFSGDGVFDPSFDFSAIEIEKLVTLEKKQDGPDTSPIDLAYWGIEYQDYSAIDPNEKRFFKLSQFFKDGSNEIRRKIKIEDIVDSQFFISRNQRGKDIDISVTRPKVSFDISYLDFLKNAGAF